MRIEVTFTDRVGTPLSADVYVPADLPAGATAPALAVGHPYGGVKEQTAGLYAQTLAERGFVTVAWDAPYQGESGGTPHFTSSPSALVESFSAAVDHLSTHPQVDPERIGVIGICGGGGWSLAAAQLDPRMKAVATVVMYDIGRSRRDGLDDTLSDAERREQLAQSVRQRTAEAQGAPVAHIRGVPEQLPADADAVTREFFDYYQTPRGHHPRATTQVTVTSFGDVTSSFPTDHLDWISPRPVLFVAGENAHSRYFSQDAYDLASEPKQLHVVPGAGHVDLYDRVDLIPWDELQTFFSRHLGTAG